MYDDTKLMAIMYEHVQGHGVTYVTLQERRYQPL